MTHRYTRRSALGALASASVVSLAGCLGSDSDSDSDSGSALRISGGVGPLPMVQDWVGMYEEDSETSFEVSGGGTGVGVSDVMNDQVDIAMMGREPDQEELDQGLFAVPMLIDTVIGTVNPNNPVLSEIRSQGLTREDFEAVFTREVETWGELVGTDSEEEIEVYGRSDASAAYKKWGEFLGGDGEAYTQSELEGLSDANHDGDQRVAESIASNENAISLNNINYVYDLESGELDDGDIQPVPIDTDGDGSLGEEEDFYDTREELLTAVEEGRYPAPPAREMYLASNGAFEGESYSFVEWVLTDGQQYVRDNGYVPLEEDRLEEAQTDLENGP